MPQDPTSSDRKFSAFLALILDDLGRATAIQEKATATLNELAVKLDDIRIRIEVSEERDAPD